jgi:flagellar biosynthetic protein FlhB
MAEFAKSLFENIDTIILNQVGASFMLKKAYGVLATIVLPLMLACFFAAFVSEGMQTGFSYTPKVIDPKLSKFNPITGAKKIFGIKGLKTFLIDFLKFLAIGTVVWLTLLIFLDHPIFYAPIPIEEVLRFIYILFLVLFAILVLLLIVIAVINFIIKKKEHHEEMKMTKQEVKDEHKSKEVAPEVKSAQRKKARELLSGQGAQDVSTADVVVTNPTHYAVALRYEKGTDHAPVVVAKGENLLARRIKAIAIEFEVPLVENKPVARSLFALGRVGEVIPLELYRVVAEILANVYKVHSYYFHRLKARRLLARKKSPVVF